MPNKNPSVVLTSVKNIRFEERPVPEIEDPHFVRIRIMKTGICGSDTHYYETGAIGKFVVEKPMVLGHESSGIIDEIGSAVTKVKVGDKVAIEPGFPSRYSKETMSGKYNLCPHMQFAATPPYDGTLAKYYCVPEDFVYKLPDNIGFDEGALCEPLAVACHAAKLGEITFGKNVIIFGAGPIGLMCAATAKAWGATNILVVDIFEDKLKLAKEIGATHTYNSTSVKFGSLKEHADYLHKTFFVPNTILECSGAAFCARLGIYCTGNSSVFVQVGMTTTEIDAYPIGVISSNESVIKGSFRYDFGDYEKAVKLISSGAIPVKKFITHRFTFKDAIKAYQFASKREEPYIKIMIDGPTDSD